jgi:hypothetical protein
MSALTKQLAAAQHAVAALATDAERLAAEHEHQLDALKARVAELEAKNADLAGVLRAALDREASAGRVPLHDTEGRVPGDAS